MARRSSSLSSAKSVKKGAAKVVYKVGVSFDNYDDEDSIDSFDDLWQEFVATDAPLTAEGLVIGNWSVGGNESGKPIIKSLVESADRLPELRALFLAISIRKKAKSRGLN